MEQVEPVEHIAVLLVHVENRREKFGGIRPRTKRRLLDGSNELDPSLYVQQTPGQHQILEVHPGPETKRSTAVNRKTPAKGSRLRAGRFKILKVEYPQAQSPYRSGTGMNFGFDRLFRTLLQTNKSPLLDLTTQQGRLTT